MRILCVIPVRGGSKGIPGKNSKLIANKPLVTWTIEQALRARPAMDVLVSTDDDKLAQIALAAGAQVPFMRPIELAQDTTATEPVIQHAIDFQTQAGLRPDAVMLLQATSPVRFAGTIDRAIKQFQTEQLDSLVGVVAQTPFLWQQNPEVFAHYEVQARPRRQDLTPEQMFYRETGSLYITKTEVFEQNQNRIGGKTGIFIMDEAEGTDIDTETDLLIAEQLLLSHFSEPKDQGK
jgi:CMP-N,N'-diacetyllegionaminic acid synthase